MKYNLFVSGVQEELEIERRAVKNLVIENPLLKDYFKVFLFEDLPAKGKSSKKAYIDEVRRSNVYVGILGNEYGNIDENMISATEREFREAQKGNKEILVFIKGRNDKIRDAQVRKLIEEIRDPESGHTYKRFDDLQDLKNHIHESLLDFLRDEGIVGRTVFDKTIETDATLKDIDDAKIKWFLEMAKKKRGYPLDVTTSVRDTLIHLDLLRETGLCNAAILLFGKKPKRFHTQSEIKCIKFSGIEVEKPFVSYHIYDGNLFEQIDKAYSFVLDSIRVPVIQQPGTVQVSRPPEIPGFVIQEAIVNAACHRDYNSTGAVQVMVFLDRVEIWNPGKLPSQLTIKSLKEPHTSYPNNPLLTDVLYLADYIQKAGSGTLEMIKQCRNKGLPDPEFIEKRGEFRIIIPRDIYTESMMEKLGLNKRQNNAIRYLKEHSRLTNKEYVQINQSISNKTAWRDLNELIEKNIIAAHGNRKQRYYALR
ncbi:transcriptional regulator [Candidatus Atribacteria bacterium HGW-Atribacteria-1]|nr:MAG: transcriptional regulator [Candidatus Atribacteria bacterium HGW-Atribacteria-1]